MIFKTDSNGLITTRLNPAPHTAQLYIGYHDADIPPGATHYKSGEFLTQPPQPTAAHVWDDTAFTWVFDVDRAWAFVRAQRAALLLACDWTQLPDVPAGTQLAWADYRQALRDITTQSDPTQITWPAIPA